MKLGDNHIEIIESNLVPIDEEDAFYDYTQKYDLVIPDDEYVEARDEFLEEQVEEKQLYELGGYHYLYEEIEQIYESLAASCINLEKIPFFKHLVQSLTISKIPTISYRNFYEQLKKTH